MAVNWPRHLVKIRNESLTAARCFSEKVDFIYIDASHVYESVMADVRAWKPHIKPGGWMGGHDYNWKFPGVLRAVFEQFGKPHRVFQDSSWLVKVSE